MTRTSSRGTKPEADHATIQVGTVQPQRLRLELRAAADSALGQAGPAGRSRRGASEGRAGTFWRSHAIRDGHGRLITVSPALSLADDNVTRRVASVVRSHSGYGTSTSRKSSATRTFAKTAFASCRIDVGSSYRGLRCVRMRRPTPASFASSAACREDE